MSGEGILGLWAALMSTLQVGDRVLCVSSGLFGDGFADMARACGAEALLLKAPEGDSPTVDQIRKAAHEFKPKVITCVQVDTPSGILNEIAPVGVIAKEVNALLCVDFVASAGGVELRTTEWGIDLGLLGTQKALSCLPDLTIVSISDRAAAVIDKVSYEGYDGLKAFRDVGRTGKFPYAPNWHAHAALNTSLKLLEKEGFDRVRERHAEVAAFTRAEVRRLGLRLYPLRDELSAPTVTAFWVPDGWTCEEIRDALRTKGIVVAGTFGPLAGRLIRIGHMGTQARIELVREAFTELEQILSTRK
jgi:aspartate aminotransferase-like enzyme